MAGVIKNNFTAGEITQLVSEREDVSSFHNGCFEATNGVILPWGGFRRRPGTIKAATAQTENSLIVPFVFNRNTTFLLEFYQATVDGQVTGYIDVHEPEEQTYSYNSGGDTKIKTYLTLGSEPIQSEIETPYFESVFDELEFEQSGDIMWIFHNSHRQAWIKRTENNLFVFERIDGLSEPINYNDSRGVHIDYIEPFQCRYLEDSTQMAISPKEVFYVITAGQKIFYYYNPDTDSSKTLNGTTLKGYADPGDYGFEVVTGIPSFHCDDYDADQVYEEGNWVTVTSSQYAVAKAGADTDPREENNIEILGAWEFGWAKPEMIIGITNGARVECFLKRKVSGSGGITLTDGYLTDYDDEAWECFGSCNGYIPPGVPVRIVFDERLVDVHKGEFFFLESSPRSMAPRITDESGKDENAVTSFMANEDWSALANETKAFSVEESKDGLTFKKIKEFTEGNLTTSGSVTEPKVVRLVEYSDDGTDGELSITGRASSGFTETESMFRCVFAGSGPQEPTYTGSGALKFGVGTYLRSNLFYSDLASNALDINLVEHGTPPVASTYHLKLYNRSDEEQTIADNSTYFPETFSIEKPLRIPAQQHAVVDDGEVAPTELLLKDAFDTPSGGHRLHSAFIEMIVSTEVSVGSYVREMANINNRGLFDAGAGGFSTKANILLWAHLVGLFGTSENPYLDISCMKAKDALKNYVSPNAIAVADADAVEVYMERVHKWTSIKCLPKGVWRSIRLKFTPNSSFKYEFTNGGMSEYVSVGTLALTVKALQSDAPFKDDPTEDTMGYQVPNPETVEGDDAVVTTLTIDDVCWFESTDSENYAKLEFFGHNGPDITHLVPLSGHNHSDFSAVRVACLTARMGDDASVLFDPLDAPTWAATAITVDKTALTLDWDAVAGASFYKVYRSEDDITYTELTDWITDTGYTDETGEYATQFYYKVRAAEDTSGGNASDLSIAENETTEATPNVSLHAVVFDGDVYMPVILFSETTGSAKVVGYTTGIVSGVEQISDDTYQMFQVTSPGTIEVGDTLIDSGGGEGKVINTVVNGANRDVVVSVTTAFTTGETLTGGLGTVGTSGDYDLVQYKGVYVRGIDQTGKTSAILGNNDTRYFKVIVTSDLSDLSKRYHIIQYDSIDSKSLSIVGMPSNTPQSLNDVANINIEPVTYITDYAHARSTRYALTSTNVVVSIALNATDAAFADDMKFRIMFEDAYVNGDIDTNNPAYLGLFDGIVDNIDQSFEVDLTGIDDVEDLRLAGNWFYGNWYVWVVPYHFDSVNREYTVGKAIKFTLNNNDSIEDEDLYQSVIRIDVDNLEDPPEPLATPNTPDLTVMSSSSIKVVLTGLDVDSNNIYYRIQRKKGDSGFVDIGSLIDPTATTYTHTDENLSHSTEYTYRCVAILKSGSETIETAVSGEASATTNAPSPAAITANQICAIAKHNVWSYPQNYEEKKPGTMYKSYWNHWNGYPAYGVFHQGRLWQFSTTTKPSAGWGSEVDSFTEYYLGSNDSNPIGINLDASEALAFAVSKKALLLGTTSDEWALSSNDSGPITPTNMIAVKHTSFGASSHLAISAGDTVLYVDKNGVYCREYLYDYQTDSFVSTDKSIMAEHILSAGVKQVAYQRSPFPVAWFLDNDGDIIGLTYNREHNIFAWCRWELDGDVNRIAVMPTSTGDRLWVTVTRGDTTQIEVFDDIMPNDVSKMILTDATEFTASLGDGIDLSGLSTDNVMVVKHDNTDGTREIADVDGGVYAGVADTKAYAGLAYETVLETSRFALVEHPVSYRGNNMRLTRIVVAYSGSEYMEFTVGDRTDISSVTLENQTKYVDLRVTSGYDDNITVVVKSDQPLPFTIQSITGYFGDRN